MEKTVHIDWALVNQPQQGSTSPSGVSFETLAGEHMGWLLGWIKGRVGDLALAEDLCQETLMRALQGFARLSDPEKFSPWLFRIARNTVTDHFRKHARRPLTLVEGGVLDQMVACENEASAEELPDLMAWISQMPENLADPFLLMHTKDMTYAEIAEHLEISEGNVQIRMFRARKWLQEKWRKATS